MFEPAGVDPGPADAAALAALVAAPLPCSAVAVELAYRGPNEESPPVAAAPGTVGAPLPDVALSWLNEFALGAFAGRPG